ncbi:MAG TPA: hypothetical protein VEC18_01800 [Myxococcota bacterium]|nr:hypothetical protein [Myxococcota bacterium]
MRAPQGLQRSLDALRRAARPLRALPRALRELETREAVLLAFFATFAVLLRAATRWQLHVPGHSMLGTALLLVLARACVNRGAAATITATLAGLSCAALGMGSSGPLVVLKLALPGLAVDLGWRWLPVRRPLLRGALLGACAGATQFLPVALAEAIAGVALPVVLSHALLAAGSKAGFGAVGGAAGLSIAERLRHHGVISPG